MLHLLDAAFGVGASASLRLDYGHGTRLVAGEVIHALRPDRLGQLLRGMDQCMAGFGARIAPDPGPGGVRTWSAGVGLLFQARLANPVSGNESELFGSLCLFATLHIKPEGRAAVLALASQSLPFLAIEAEEAGLISLSKFDNLGGGVTPATVKGWILGFTAEVCGLYGSLRGSGLLVDDNPWTQ